MISSNARYKINLERLQFIANKLEELIDNFVFLGGSIVWLLITDKAAPGVRITEDIDCIVETMSINDYYKTEKKLKTKGFQKSMEDDLICRFHCDGIILDVMTIEKSVLGFGNSWYKASFKNANTLYLNQNLSIKLISAPYFLATKLEAFKDRGQNDFIMSHDFEDIIILIDGRTELVDEIKDSSIELKSYLKESFSNFLNNNNFIYNLPGLLNDYGSLAQERSDIVIQRIEKIVCRT